VPRPFARGIVMLCCRQQTAEQTVWQSSTAIVQLSDQGLAATAAHQTVTSKELRVLHDVASASSTVHAAK
jgi:hypothetical protein